MAFACRVILTTTCSFKRKLTTPSICNETNKKKTEAMAMTYNIILERCSVRKPLEEACSAIDPDRRVLEYIDNKNELNKSSK